MLGHDSIGYDGIVFIPLFYYILFDLRSPFDSILDAVFTVSPNKQYLGIFKPTTPATHDPGNSKT